MKPKKRTDKLTAKNGAAGFDTLAESITKTLNKYAERQDDPDVGRSYITYRQSTKSWKNITKRDLKVELPDLPTLIGNDFYSGLTRLAEYCERAARQLNKTTRKPDPALVRTPEDLASEVNLTARTIRNWGEEREDELPEYKTAKGNIGYLFSDLIKMKKANGEPVRHLTYAEKLQKKT